MHLKGQVTPRISVSVIDQDYQKRRKIILIECGANTFLLILTVSIWIITVFR
jgi:dUTPase